LPPPPLFGLFGDTHLWTLGLITAVAVLLPLAVRLAWPLAARPVAVLLAVLLLAQEAAHVALQAVRFGISVQLLPLHLCSLAVLLTAWMLVTRSPRVFEVAYFWAMGGTTQALLTPDLHLGFPHPAFLFFFASHGLVIVGVLYAVIALRLRPYPISIVRVALITLALAAAVLGVNLWLGTNFLYLMAKPAGASLLDWFGPWPWYWLGLIGAALVSFLVLYAPFFLLDLLRGGGGVPASGRETGVAAAADPAHAAPRRRGPAVP
jgi:hypothetical integral membrane protein (TIGR02206 family)